MGRLLVHVENYKAIKSADVELADLTVLAGVNASGKSTLARLFHRLVCIEANFERYAASVAMSGYVSAVLDPLTNAVRGADFRLHHRLRRVKMMLEGRDFKSFEKKTKFLRNEIEDLFNQSSVSELFLDSRLLEALDRNSGNMMENPTPVSKVGVRVWMENELKKQEDLYAKMILRGDGSAALFLVQRFQGDYFDPMIMFLSQAAGSVIKFKDGDVPILDTTNIGMPFKPIFNPRQSLYVARPSVDMPTVSESTVELNGIEYERSVPQENLADLHIQDFLGGSIEYPEDKGGAVRGDQWQFNMSGGSKIPIAQCADGIKSMSAILMLDKCGLLQSDSLLIIDEPEVHLHPRWVVEMARVLVCLAKYRKVRVLVTTHSPDLVHALRDFSANEDFGSNTCFYLATEDLERKGRYNYEGLGMNIGPIFTVFNQAKDKIASIAKDIREGVVK